MNVPTTRAEETGTYKRPKWQPTDKRGVALLDHVMEVIEEEAREAAQARQVSAAWLDEDTRAGHWDQGDWIQLNGAALDDAGVNVLALALEQEGLSLTEALESDYPVNIALPPAELGGLCGTAMCFAGHATFEVGDQPLFYTDLNYLAHNVSDDGKTLELGQVFGDLSIHQVHPVDGAKGETADVGRRAAELLELDSETADILFEASNTLEDLREMVARIKEHGGLTWNLKCSACDVWPWHCVDEGPVCDNCGYHEDRCECEDDIECANCYEIVAEEGDLCPDCERKESTANGGDDD
ncbi:hypothetical protein FDJ57_gp72 [Gordonia phage Sour]|uniref:Uncharacterized protein n=1 Tax=Gordonia phage Sour TaxID=2182349 RepID=A0A2U8UKW6_9CAUD|nr:hypothetical protein FDJ57_gp72 [Gordonia phage Sour]AWN04273.1 hypothetical protein PBI_SOUR_72 [Gordonia phage Sour]